MTTRAYIIGDSDVVLWGISSRERLGRQIGSIDALELVEDIDALSGSDTVLLLRADFLFEVRTLTSLMAREGVLMHEGTPAAAHVAFESLPAALALLNGGPEAEAAGLEQFETADIQTFERSLRRTDPPTLLPMREADRARRCRISSTAVPTRA